MIQRIATVLAAALLAACGGSSGSGGPPDTSGTCDWTALATGTLARKCLEQSGPAVAIADQRDACLSNQGVWNHAPCPAGPDREGCCTYQFGLDFRECFYTKDPPRTSDPEFLCTSFPGVWTPN